MFNLFKTARFSRKHVIQVGADLGDAYQIPTDDVATGMVFIPAESGITMLTGYASAEKCDGVFLEVESQPVTAGKAFRLPDEWLSGAALKITANASAAIEVITKG